MDIMREKNCKIINYSELRELIIIKEKYKYGFVLNTMRMIKKISRERNL